MQSPISIATSFSSGDDKSRLLFLLLVWHEALITAGAGHLQGKEPEGHWESPGRAAAAPTPWVTPWGLWGQEGCDPPV